MTKTCWIVLIISALTDAIINGAGALTAAMVSGEMVQMPSKAVWLIAGSTASVAFARTIQQALRKEPPKE